MAKDGIPKFIEFINEANSSQKVIEFDNINGQIKIYLKFQETDGYDTMKPVSEPDAELRLDLSEKDQGMIWYYNSSDYEDDRRLLLKDIRDAADEFDQKLKQIFQKRNFTR
jgi:hypothetical protein